MFGIKSLAFSCWLTLLALGWADDATPMTAPDFVQRGKEEMAAGDDHHAIGEFTRAIQLDPKNVAAYFNRGLAQESVEDDYGAIDDFSSALDLDPKNAEAYAHRGGERQFLGGDGMSDYEKALALDPKNILAYVNRSYALYAKGDFDGTIADCDRVIALQAPKELEGYQELALAKYAKGDFAGALTACNQFMARAPAVNIYLNRALIKMRLGDSGGALADCNHVVAQAPRWIEAYFDRGAIKQSKGDLAGAAEDYRQVIRFAEPTASFLTFSQFNLWVVQTQLNQRPIADLQLSAFLAAKVGSRYWNWYAKIGSFLLGQISEEALISAAATPNPESSREMSREAWYYAGMKYLAIDDKASARDALQKCIAAFGKNPLLESERDNTQYFMATADLKALGQTP